MQERYGVKFDYTIPKIKRELKQYGDMYYDKTDYTIPKIKRELKQRVF